MRQVLVLGVLGFAATGCIHTNYVPDTPSGTKVRVSVESESSGAVLYQRIGADVRVPVSVLGNQGSRRRAFPVFAPRCDAPCTVDVDPAAPVYVSGDGITTSSVFTLDKYQTPVSVHVQPGSSAQSGIGLVGVLGVLGGFAGVATGGFLSLGGALSGNRDWMTPGFVTLGAGAATMIAGAVLLATGATHVRVSPMGNTGAMSLAF
jgi:hypothetical protein